MSAQLLIDNLREAVRCMQELHRASQLDDREMTSIVNFMGLQLALLEAHTIPSKVLPVMTLASIAAQAATGGRTFQIIQGGKA